MDKLEKPHPECADCKWQDFPYCNGIYIDGERMGIAYKTDNFKDCSQKEEKEPRYEYWETDDPSIISMEDRVRELEQKVIELETEVETLKTQK